MSRDEEGGDSATRPIGRIAAVQPSSSLRVPERWVVHCQGKMDNNNNNNNNETRTWADDLVQAIWRPVVFGLGVGIPLLYIVRTRVIGKRYPTAGQVPPEAFANRQVIKGYVVSVGDSDNFRLYHTPGFGWGWLRKVPTKQKGVCMWMNGRNKKILSFFLILTIISGCQNSRIKLLPYDLLASMLPR